MIIRIYEISLSLRLGVKEVGYSLARCLTALAL